MIKPVKRNKRLKWINSHYADFYKAALFLQRCQMASVAAQGAAQQTVIISSDGSIGKFAAIALNAYNTKKSLTRFPKVEGRVTKCM